MGYLRRMVSIIHQQRNGTKNFYFVAKKWRHHRKTITPSFNQKILESFVDVFADKSKVFAEKISKLVGKKDVDWYILVSRCTLDTICGKEGLRNKQ